MYSDEFILMSFECYISLKFRTEQSFALSMKRAM